MKDKLLTQEPSDSLELATKSASLTTADMIKIGETFDSTKMSLEKFLETYETVNRFTKNKN